MKGMDRRSREIPACLILLATSAALAGCEPRRDCIDASGQKLPDSACSAAQGRGSSAHFIYGGRGGTRVGDTVSGGSTTRGGFGSSDGGEGGEGGHGGGEGGGE